MTDHASSLGGRTRVAQEYTTVVPELGRLLLSQHLASIDGKEVTVDEFGAAVEAAHERIQSKKVFLDLQLVRPDYVQFLIDREAWETFCGGPTQKGNPNYRPFPVRDPRIARPLPQYFDPGTLTPDSYGLIYRDNVHPDCPNCNCGTLSEKDAGYFQERVYKDGGSRVTTPAEEYAAFQIRLEEQSRKMGYKDSDERWEKECEIEQAKEDERIRIAEEAKKLKDAEDRELEIQAMVGVQVKVRNARKETNVPESSKMSGKQKGMGKKKRHGCSLM